MLSLLPQTNASKSMFVVRDGGHFVFMQIWFKKQIKLSGNDIYLFSLPNMFEKLILKY